MKLLPFSAKALGVGLLLGLSGCQEDRCIGGKIYDFDTQQPLQEVRCRALTGKQESSSDEKGRYQVCGEPTDWFAAHQDLQVGFYKDGYEPQTFLNPPDSLTVFLKKMSVPVPVIP